ncbi:M23 family metallopeptidase [Marivirga arenosa]|uniref:M23 family metallopeptidase n=1 Tax=Marivirga arenosa TaxID=3059076 RepID=A0AA51RCP6_9BACT|nr:M23 family metallopeptidase [Marivirga sp. ABR2-2]WMN05975.1 M23 family metallopeptidase [Marivirga sp. ABR2-2]
MRTLLSTLSFVIITLMVFQSASGQEKPISISYDKSTDGFEFYATNHEQVPYSVKINFQKLDNLKLHNANKELQFTVPPNSNEIKILELMKVTENQGTSFDFSYLYTIGDPSLKVDKDFPYLLPYKHGKKVRVGQGNNGSGTHKGINAIDFNLEIGDSIYAARSGIVVDVKEDSNKGGNGPQFEPFGNFIKVYHEDGTLGDYVHLVKNGSLVKKGDRIEEGQLIGISGNTGWSSGPHLHFMVTHNKNFQSITLPIKFLNYKQELFIPRESKSYYALHPSKGKFEVEDEESFNEKEFETKMEMSQLRNKIEFTSEEYGEFYLVYVDNGMNNEMSGVLKINLNNLISTKDLPYKFTVPAKTKMYLLALKPDDASSSFGYQISGEFR